MRVAINGAGIAGPTLAFWLRRSGHEVLIVEESPSLRTGGYVIDFWGTGFDVAERMGLIPEIRSLGYQVREVRFVDERGRRTGGFGVDVFRRLTGDRFTSLRRSDLATAIWRSCEQGVETILGDSIVSIREQGPRVQVGFEHAAPREVDLVIGADGLHSRVRRLAFGSEVDCEKMLGYHVAAFEAEGYEPRDELVYVSHGVPGRQVSRFAMRGDRTLFLFVFRDEYLRGEPATVPDRKAALAEAFAGVGWEAPQILAALRDAQDLYFDRVSQIRMDRWTNGRTALIGDAAACISLMGGEGTGLAMTEAYVLAGELHECRGDHVRAFARYQDRLRDFLRMKQATAARFASSFAPRTAFGLAFRNAVTGLLRIPFVSDWFLGRGLRDRIELPDYGFGAGGSGAAQNG